MKVGLQSVERRREDYESRGNLVLPRIGSVIEGDPDRFPLDIDIPPDAYVAVARKELRGKEGKFRFGVANTGLTLYIDSDGYEIRRDSV